MSEMWEKEQWKCKKMTPLLLFVNYFKSSSSSCHSLFIKYRHQWVMIVTWNPLDVTLLIYFIMTFIAISARLISSNLSLFSVTVPASGNFTDEEVNGNMINQENSVEYPLQRDEVKLSTKGHQNINPHGEYGKKCSFN